MLKQQNPFSDNHTFSLPLDASRTIAACQFLHLGECDHVVVPFNGVLQRRCRYRKLYRRLGCFACQQRVNQAAAETITTAYPVDDMEIVLFGKTVFTAGNVVEHGAPTIVEGGMTLPQGYRYFFTGKSVGQLFGNALIAFPVDFSGIDVGGFGLNAKYVLGVLFVGDAHIHILA